MILGPTLLLYLMIGLGVAVAFYATDNESQAAERWFAMVMAIPFWPLYIPLLLARKTSHPPTPAGQPQPAPQDEMAGAIAQVDAELEGALGRLDGWAEDVLARERVRIQELRAAWIAQAERIREMDRLLALPEYAVLPGDPPPAEGPLGDRLRNCQRARRQNIERLREVRRRAHDDLMGTLAWVRELVSMIHLAKFTGAPAARAEELVAQIAAAVEGLSAVTWQDAETVSVGGST